MSFIAVDAPRSFPKADLVSPTGSHYRLFAARIDRRPLFLPPSRRRRALLNRLSQGCRRLRAIAGVRDVSLFSAILRAPGRSELLRQRPDAVPRPHYDVVLLVELEDRTFLEVPEVASVLAEIESEVVSAARTSLRLTMRNVRHLGPVDHERPGVFLFNYFYADSLEQNLEVWEHTAGWFQDQTGLDNSTVLQPFDDETSPYTIINHCRWDRLTDVAVPLRTRRSFRSYVLAHFDANDTAPMPVLYRLVR